LLSALHGPHAWPGHDPRRKPGLVLGHEFVGRIAQSAARGLEPGTRWTGNPLITCGHCEYCEYCVQGAATTYARTAPWSA